MTRLFELLKDEARDTVKAHFVASNCNCKVIMETLEMRFANSPVILNKLLKEIRELPAIDVQKTNLVEFVTKLKSSVDVIKSLNFDGYLNGLKLAER